MLAAPFATRVGRPLVGHTQSLLARFLPSSIVSGFEKRLIIAGEPMSLQAFLAFQLLFIGAGLVVILLAVASVDAPPLGRGLLVVAGLMMGLIPAYWLRIRVGMRKTAILRALPDAVDLIVTTVEAGLAIDAALSEVGQETRGPLGEELRLTVRETTLGRSRRDALLRLVERTQVPELKTFVQSIVQAEQTGIPIGQVLRTQAAQIRLRKRQWAEGQAQKAPVKMVMVLVVLVLPAMLAVAIGPAIMRLQDNALY
jgi:tight adherence protein C